MAKSKVSSTSNKELMSATPFLGGLNTELNGLTDSTDFTADELNMMIRTDNTRSRRCGIDYEEKYVFNGAANEGLVETDFQDLAFNCYEWTDINQPDTAQTYTQIPYIVVQIGGKLIFYRNNGIPYSGDQTDFSLDLAGYRINPEAATGTQSVGGSSLGTISVVLSTFKTKITTAGEYVFTASVSGSTTTWKLGEDTVTLSDYGITITGTAVDEDAITVTYTNDQSYKKERCKFTSAYGCLFVTSKAIKPIMLKAAQKDEDQIIVQTDQHCTVSCSMMNGKKSRGYYKDDTHFVQFYLNDIPVSGEITPTAYRAAGGPVSSEWATYDGGLMFPCSTQIAWMWNNMISSEDRRGITATPKYSNAVPTRWGIKNLDTGGVDQDIGYGYSPPDYLKFSSAYTSALAGLKVSIRTKSWAKTKGTIDNTFSANLSGGTTYQNKVQLSLTIRDTSVGANDYITISEAPEKTSYAHLYNLMNQGWTLNLLAYYYVKTSPHSFPGNNLAQQYLKDSTTTKFKPESLINTTFGNTPAAKGHFILDFFSQDRCTVANLTNSMSNLVVAINEAFQAEGSSETVTLDDILDLDFPVTPRSAIGQVPIVKPRRDFVADICAYAGRIFYACGDVLLYSQVIAEDTSRADMCYTDADPTSEELSDIVETDGGLISLPEIGEAIRIVPVGEYLCVFGSRGARYLTGTANNIFTATAYTAGTLSSSTTQAPDSFVETEYGVFYWGTTGVFVLGISNGMIATQDMSSDKIATWYGRLTNTQHKWCKGVYSSSKKKIYWFYPRLDSKPRRLDMCLVYDIRRAAFTVQQVATEIKDEAGEILDGGLPEVVSGCMLKVPYKAVKEYPVIANNDEKEDTVSVDTYHALMGTFTTEKNIDLWHYSGDGGGDYPDQEAVTRLIEASFVTPQATATHTFTGQDFIDSGLQLIFRVDFNNLVNETYGNLTVDQATRFTWDLNYDTNYVHANGTNQSSPYEYAKFPHAGYTLVGFNNNRCLTMYPCPASSAYAGKIMFCIKRLIYSPSTVYGEPFNSSKFYKNTMVYGGGLPYQTDHYYAGDFHIADISMTDQVWFRFTKTGTQTFKVEYSKAIARPTQESQWTTLIAAGSEQSKDDRISTESTNAYTVNVHTNNLDFVILDSNNEVVFTPSYNENVAVTHEFYYNPSDKTGEEINAYSDSAMTTKIGTVADMITSYGSDWYLTAEGTWTRETVGSDHEAYKIACYGDTSVFVSSSTEATLFEGAAFPENSLKTFTDPDLVTMDPRSLRVNLAKQDITDRTELSKPNKIGYTVDYTDYRLGLVPIVDDDGFRILADDPVSSEEFTFESSILLCLDLDNSKVTFGDFRNNRMTDWAASDYTNGVGYTFDSYLISHPMTAASKALLSGNRVSDIVHNKTMPYLLSYFKRTEKGQTTTGAYVYPSACQGSVLWDWRTDGDNGKWDSPQELYRFNERTLFSEGYVTSKTNIRGIGRAYQVKLEGIEDKQFIIEGVIFDMWNDGRI